MEMKKWILSATSATVTSDRVMFERVNVSVTRVETGAEQSPMADPR
jgi:hypothetical protein